jgi:hypothetical protein
MCEAPACPAVLGLPGPPSVRVGDTPFDVVLGDVNADSKLDLVSTYNGGTVSVAIGNGDGTFGAPFSVGTCDSQPSPALGDLNGDTKPDLVVASTAGGVDVYLNLTLTAAGTATFGTRQNIAAGMAVDSTSLGDVNGDGKLDLAVANGTARTVTVLLNTSAAGVLSFAKGQTFGTAGSAQDALFTDVNGDGRPDLAVADSASVIDVLLNTTTKLATTASFAADSTFPIYQGGGSLDTADFNADGKPDLVVNDGAAMSVLLDTTAMGAAAANFAPYLNVSGFGNVYDLRTGDVDGDGRPDIVSVEYGAGVASVYLDTTAPGAGTASFAPRQDFPCGSGPVRLALGDLSGDGKPDLAISFGDDISVLVDTGTAGAPSFAIEHAWATGGGSGSDAVADLNADGKPDVVTANFGADTISVLLGNGDGTLMPRADFGVLSPSAVAIADFNGDGTPDLVACNTAQAVVFLNTTTAGATTPTFATAAGFDSGGLVLGLCTTGDANNDGRPDIVASAQGMVVVFADKTPGGATMPSFALPVASAGGSNGIALADFNGDGALDVASSDYAGTLHVALNTTAVRGGPPAFSTVALFSAPIGNYLTTADLNLDGKADLVVPGAVLLNTTGASGTAPSFANAVAAQTGRGPDGVGIGDFNADGKPDLLVANANGDTVSLALDTTAMLSGSASFAAKNDYVAGASPVWVSIGDLNGDGHPDAAVTSFNSSNVDVLLSQCLP